MPRIDRNWWRLASQDTARTNAAEASRKLRDQRHEHEEVDAYLVARRRSSLDTDHVTSDAGSPSQRTTLPQARTPDDRLRPT